MPVIQSWLSSTAPNQPVLTSQAVSKYRPDDLSIVWSLRSFRPTIILSFLLQYCLPLLASLLPSFSGSFCSLIFPVSFGDSLVAVLLSSLVTTVLQPCLFWRHVRSFDTGSSIGPSVCRMGLWSGILNISEKRMARRFWDHATQICGVNAVFWQSNCSTY